MRQVKYKDIIDIHQANRYHKNNERKILEQIIKPVAAWFDDGSDNEQAELALKTFYNQLKRSNTDKFYISRNIYCEHFSYIRPLYAMKIAFDDKLYKRVCNELEDIVHFEPVFQARIKNNLLRLINDYLHIE